MGLWSKGLERAQTGELRKESNLVTCLDRIKKFLNEYMCNNLGYSHFRCTYFLDKNRCRWVFSDMSNDTCHEVIQNLTNDDFIYSILLDFRTKTTQFKKNDSMIRKMFSKIYANMTEYFMTGCRDEDILLKI